MSPSFFNVWELGCCTQFLKSREIAATETEFWPRNSLKMLRQWFLGWDKINTYGPTHCYEALSFNKLGFGSNIFLVHWYSHKITGGFAHLEWQHATGTEVVEVTLRSSAAADCCWKYNQTGIRQQLNILPLEDFIFSFCWSIWVVNKSVV